MTIEEALNYADHVKYLGHGYESATAVNMLADEVGQLRELNRELVLQAEALITELEVYRSAIWSTP